MSQFKGKWAGRFVWAAVLQGLIAVIVTVLIVDPLSYFNVKPYFDPAMIIAGGGAGTWLFVGYALYLVVGVVGIAVTALFYLYLEEVKGKTYHGAAGVAAWGHLVLMNIGVAASMLLMIYAGYLGGWAAAATAEGGLGLTDEQIHVKYLSQFVDPIGALAVVACIGALLGGLGYLMAERSAPGPVKPL